ncbi:serine/threonine protein kinase [Archangium primigenium]|uniref:serine/threonine protein kinase n=1 Tax=[Archangium] primigenium TaxID=2792470 RepID=UPI001958F582|nr:serine/threonine-protein kinase [Archangium primigenium]MBM7113141.1 serine/threonine protein kinase [Archangium primigenium]
MSTSQGEGPPRPGALRPGTQVGAWRVVEALGVGGQGAVYRVEDVARPGEFYALKLSLHARDKRAEREVALMMSQAAHPHVVRFHGCARWPHPSEGWLGIVMDWVPGQALDAWAESGATFRRLALVGATVARTLGELHARGVLHRDLKPEHIRVRASDGQPVLLDFGAGWYEGAPPLTTGPLPPATPYLISPEAAYALWRSAKQAGVRHVFQPTDDLYALGICLYRATTGHYPFPEGWPPEVLLLASVHVLPLAPARVNPRVPRALSDIVMRLLEKDPRARYPNGAALEAALLAATEETDAEWDAPIFEWDEQEHEIVRPPRPRPTGSTAPPVARTRRHGSHAIGWAAAALLMLLPVVCLAPAGHIPRPAWFTEVHVEPTSVQPEQAPLPARNQKQAPCKQGLEVELSGVCWLRLWQQPPNCPSETVAYKGQCLLPVAKSRPLPTSVDAGTPGAR